MVAEVYLAGFRRDARGVVRVVVYRQVELYLYDGEEFEVVCVIEGLGTNLFSRMVYMRNSLRIPLSELDYAPSPDEEGYIVIDPQSLQNAISVHYSDVKVVAVRNIPPIKLPVEE